MHDRKLQQVLVISLITFLSITALAQSTNIVTLNGGRTVLNLGVKPQTIVPSQPFPAKAVTIYSNLGTKNYRYNPDAAVGILGRNAGQPWPQAVGNGFTPVVDHVVQGIQLGLGYVQGTNEVLVALTDDDNGTPGKVLHAWHISNLPAFGTCCTLQTVYYMTGIPVKANTQYWVVVSPADPNGDTYATWDNNIQNLNGNFNNNLGSGWQGQSYQTLGAFAVYGQ